MTIHILQTANEITPRHWKWSVWLDGPSEELNSIQSVTYQLHSTFKKPIREIDDRNSGFRLESSGWGQFMIYIMIKYQNGKEEKRQHWLTFSNVAPSKELEGMFGEKFKDKTPTAFLSFSVADAAAAMIVRNRLEAKGIEVLDPSTLEVGENLSDGIANIIDQSDFGISIVSDVTSKWVNLETLQMKEHNLPVFQVDSGSPIDSMNIDLKVHHTEQTEATAFSDLINSTLNFDKD